MEKEKKKIYVPKLFAILSFSIVLSCLTIAFVSDFIIFLNAIIEILLGILLCGILFVLLLVAMAASIIVVFGAYLIQEYGFWPATVTLNFFKQVTQDVEITKEQIQTFEIVRIILVIFLAIAFILAIVALAMHKHAKKKKYDNIRVCKPFAIIAIVLAILGILTAVIMFLILGSVGV